MLLYYHKINILLIYKKSKTHLYILDSLYKKSYKITYEKFEEIDEKIYVIADEFKNNLFSIKNHKSLLLIPIISTIETIFLLSNTVLLQQIIDNGFKDAIIYILVQILLLIITTFKMNEFLKTFKKIDSKIIYNTTKGIYNLKKDFISNHDINELYFRTYDAYSYKGMILSFFFELISDVITLTLTLILMIFYLRLLTILILLICLLAVLFCIKIFKKVQLIIEQRRTSEYDFLNTYRDSFSSKDDIYFKKDKTLEEKSLKKLINFQKDDYVLQRTNMLKNLFFLYFQSIIISFVVILYFTNAFDYLSIGSLIALINLITLLLQPILNICSKIPEFSNYNLIKQRLKDIFDNID